VGKNVNWWSLLGSSLKASHKPSGMVEPSFNSPPLHGSSTSSRLGGNREVSQVMMEEMMVHAEEVTIKNVGVGK
jgi:hypothetical protein